MTNIVRISPSNAIFADNDAYYFADFSENILGIKPQNIKLISNQDANINEIKKALKRAF